MSENDTGRVYMALIRDREDIVYLSYDDALRVVNENIEDNDCKIIVISKVYTFKKHDIV